MKATVIAVMVMADVEARVAVDGDSSTINESDGGNGAAGSSQPTNQPTLLGNRDVAANSIETMGSRLLTKPNQGNGVFQPSP